MNIVQFMEAVDTGWPFLCLGISGLLILQMFHHHLSRQTATTSSAPPTPEPPRDAGPFRTAAPSPSLDADAIFKLLPLPQTCSVCEAASTRITLQHHVRAYDKPTDPDHGKWSVDVQYNCNRTVWWSPARGLAGDACPTTLPKCLSCGYHIARPPARFCNTECAARWAEENA